MYVYITTMYKPRGHIATNHLTHHKYFLNFQDIICKWLVVVIYISNLIEIIQNLQICYLKFHAMNNDFQAILTFSHNSNTLILDKV